jgi:hypothetical protein
MLLEAPDVSAAATIRTAPIGRDRLGRVLRCQPGVFALHTWHFNLKTVRQGD